ncbi:serine endopeptidase [Colletotrichum limetticola]|uniref:Serine endopeptidase n=1 Tax=Colletotrichum limetticola TaxID=1209924 RepID=A0ABQ9PCM1_9PEZI|nr:serine endopeptidase [Colletotrichum limetticola]
MNPTKILYSIYAYSFVQLVSRSVISSRLTSTLPLWAVNFDTSDPANGCDVFPETTPDLSGHIVLIRRGTCTFTQKSTNAAAKGAKYIIFYSDIIGTIPITAVVPGIEGMAMVTAGQGAEWISKLEEGTNILVHMVKPNDLPSIG